MKINENQSISRNHENEWVCLYRNIGVHGFFGNFAKKKYFFRKKIRRIYFWNTELSPLAVSFPEGARPWKSMKINGNQCRVQCFRQCYYGGCPVIKRQNYFQLTILRSICVQSQSESAVVCYQGS